MRMMRSLWAMILWQKSFALRDAVPIYAGSLLSMTPLPILSDMQDSCQTAVRKLSGGVPKVVIGACVQSQ